MSLLSRNQRSFIHAQTHIDPLIIDRCTEAFDALIKRGDVEVYRNLISTAIAQMGYPGRIPNSDRPTAVDKMKILLIRAYATQERISIADARSRLIKLQESG